SLQHLGKNRATLGDAARFLRAEAPESVGQHGAFADYIEVERTAERAVDALLGDLLQHVVVDRAEQVQEALATLHERKGGRCGFLVLYEARVSAPRPTVTLPAGVRSVRDVVKATGPYADLIARVLPDACIAETFEQART